MVTFEKTLRSITNPFDGSVESVSVVVPILDGVRLERESYTFEDTATDAAIQAKIEADLTAKGYL